MQFNQPSIEILREQISYKDYLRWQIYYQKNPFGEARQDIRFATLRCQIANMFSKNPHKLEDFMLNFEPKKPMSDQDLKAAICAAMGVNTNERN